MSDNYYIRIRGRIHGPMDLDRLQGLAQKGQLSKIHELSTDNKNWRPASSMPEIFERKREAAVARTTGRSEQASTGAVNLYDNSATVENSNQFPGVQPGPPQGAMQVKDWFYSIDGAQHGPVTQQELTTLIRYGSLERDDMVWQSSMTQWAEAGHVPSLVSAFRKGGRNAKGSRSSRNQNSDDNDGSRKKKSTAILLGFFLGFLGAHEFYMGNPLRGILYIVMWLIFLVFNISLLANDQSNIFVSFTPTVVILISILIIAVKNDEDFQASCHKGWSL